MLVMSTDRRPNRKDMLFPLFLLPQIISQPQAVFTRLALHLPDVAHALIDQGDSNGNTSKAGRAGASCEQLAFVVRAAKGASYTALESSPMRVNLNIYLDNGDGEGP